MHALTTMDKNNVMEGMDINGDHDLNFYDRCEYGKHHCTPFPLSGGFCAKKILKLVYTNLCDLMAASHGEAKYFLGRHFFIP
jgi:hypothetical protein